MHIHLLTCRLFPKPSILYANEEQHTNIIETELRVRLKVLKKVLTDENDQVHTLNELSDIALFIFLMYCDKL